MEVRFIGPLGKVTGSCTWMRDMENGWNFLVDCGMQQGEMTSEDWNRSKWPFSPSEIKFVILTHAHIDHCGLIPALYKNGFKGSVYCTKETAELAQISLLDAAKFPNAPFEEKHINQIKWHEPKSGPILGSYHPVDHDLFLQFFRSGHVVGAVSASIYWGPRGEQKNITFSGDIGPSFEDQETLPLLRFNMNPAESNFVVIESTYGGVVRSPEQRSAETRLNALRSLVDQAIERRGILALPAFALGRTQNLLFDLSMIYHENPEKYATVQYLIDSPAAAKMHPVIHRAYARSEATTTKMVNAKVRPVWLGKQFFRMLGLTDKEPEHHQRANEIVALTLGQKISPRPELADLGNDLAKRWKGIFRSVDRNSRAQLMAESVGRATVVIVSSGMCDGGPAASWIPKILGDERNHIALTGYCAAGSVGRQLSGLAGVPANELQKLSDVIEWEINGVPKFAVRDVRASVSILSGYSEHADQTDLLYWLMRQRNGQWLNAGEAVFIQHGDDRSRQSLADAIDQKARQNNLCVMPVLPSDPELWFDLDRGGEAVVQDKKRNDLLQKMLLIQQELSRLDHQPWNGAPKMGRHAEGRHVGT